MRIDAFNKISQLYPAGGTKKIKNRNGSESSDRLEISQIGKDIQVVKTAVAGASDIRTDKVDKIKEQITSGTYNVSMEEVADKLVTQYFDTLL